MDPPIPAAACVGTGLKVGVLTVLKQARGVGGWILVWCSHRLVCCCCCDASMCCGRAFLRVLYFAVSESVFTRYERLIE